ncbi:MAG: hypothetical protein K9M82_05285 [Deltaproteobacteria bacterium]|nr:hypothetical protein [Deltaproteobacteria bacterium]
MKPTLTRIAFLMAIAWFAGGCATGTNLEPAPVETMESSGDLCIGGCEGIQLIADPDAWKGTPEIIDHVTPIKITVKNNHGSAIRVLYRQFALIAPDGKRFSALPPFEIKGIVEVPSPPTLSGPPAFRSHNFFVSPHHHAYVPGVPMAGEPFPYDPFYYDRYYRTWKEIELPTEHMKTVALPEGDIRDQGEVTGFVYFEKVVGVEMVELHMDLMEADDGTIFGRIRIPFNVVE